MRDHDVDEDDKSINVTNSEDKQNINETEVAPVREQEDHHPSPPKEVAKMKEEDNIKQDSMQV
jgi:hypothetical protein